MQVPGFARKLIDNGWNIAGITIGFATGLSGTLITSGSVVTQEIVTISAVYGLSFLGLLLYMILHINAFRKLVGEHKTLHVDKTAAETALARNVDFNRKADEAFKQLSRHRTVFDTRNLRALTGVMSGVENRQSVKDDLDEALDDYLVEICNVAVEAISARKMAPRDELEANIKLILKAKDDQGERYKLFARSDRTREERLNTDTKDKPFYIVKRNGYFDILKRPNSTRSHVIIDDIALKIREWVKESGEAILEPSRAAADYYKHCLAIAISGEHYQEINSARCDRAALETSPGRALLGAIFIDSNKHDFDEHDVAIMEELQFNVYSALRSFDTVWSIISTHPVTVVEFANGVTIET